MDAVEVSRAIDVIAIFHQKAPVMSYASSEGEQEVVALSRATTLQAAFAEFLRAIEYAENLHRSTWQFAVDLPSLRRLKLSDNDLRWMAGAGLIDFAIEATKPNESERAFRRPPKLVFCRRTCFVLTARGSEIGRVVAQTRSHFDDCENSRVKLDLGTPANPTVAPLTPSWDRDQQELKVGAVVVKRFRVPAASQEAILAAFEEEAWPPRIDDPLPPRREVSPTRRLQETIKSLNRNQKEPLIRFLGDGNGRGILWKYCGLLEPEPYHSRLHITVDGVLS